VSPASDVERRRLHDTFAALCRIVSPSGAERPCADAVAARLAAIGVTVDEDGAGPILGGDCGNLFARIPGTGEGSVLFCAHLDTVPVAAPIEPVLRDGVWENANDAILGADNKVAVATMLTLAERLARHPAEAAVELLFTVGEEVALAGAKEFETARLNSRVGFAFDNAMPVGGVVVSSPTYYRITAELRGVAAHAGLRPELGRSAVLAAARAIARMPLGRIDAATTANIGVIEGGTAANVVPEHCRIVGETRSFDAATAERLASELASCLADAANDPECECDLDVELERQFEGYRVRTSSPELALAFAALRDCGLEPAANESGGGSDANALRARGIAVLNLANGTERNHQPDESVSAASLEQILDIALAIVERAGTDGP
jgi:tripeptide aminopeptidase